MPELNWYWGYPASLAVMAAIAAGWCSSSGGVAGLRIFSTLKDSIATDSGRTAKGIARTERVKQQ